MGMSWFKGWTEPLPLGQSSIMECGYSYPFLGSWHYSTPALNKWLVEHVRNDIGSRVVILSYWDTNKKEWHEVYLEHVSGMEWPDIWAQMSTTVDVCRESMLP